MFLKNAWYQAGWSHDLPEGTLLSRRLLDEPLVLFRDSAGAAHAVEDMCPHRFAPLSKGRATRDGLVCGYHGLTFGGDGRCVHNPHGPVPGKMRVRSYPVLERHLGLWVWMGDADRADPALLPNLSFIDDAPPEGRIFGYLPTRANYLLLSDNILDLSHADYLHPTTLGGIITGSKMTIEERDDTVFVNWWAADVDPPPVFARMVPPGARADIWTEVLWSAPAIMVLRTGAVPAGTPRPSDDLDATLHNMSPETAATSHYFYCMARKINLEPEFTAFLRSAIDQAFEQEDKPMLEAQQARIGDREFWSMGPMLISVDNPAVRARRRLERLIAAEA